MIHLSEKLAEAGHVLIIAAATCVIAYYAILGWCWFVDKFNNR